ncbi:MAG: phosphate acyltransferase PlsX [Rickettsiales bacterium]
MTKMSSGSITIAIDAMGGDKAPESVIHGAELFLKKYPKKNSYFRIYGDRNKINSLVRECELLRDNSELIHTDQAVSPDEKPSMALRTGRKSSMQLAINSVKAKESNCCVSAGNTGALMAMAKITLRPMHGIHRPAICAIFPTMKKQIAMLDLGANVECDANNLYQFAIMGEAFARVALNVRVPRIGLLNIGSEDLKGKDSVQLAHKMLNDTNLPLDYRGYVEGNQIVQGNHDVIVTDGFSGNIALKSIEGAVKLFKHMMTEGFKSSILSKIGYLMSKKAMKSTKDALDPRYFNGAMFVGLKGIVVKSHGSMDDVGIANAIKVAYDLAAAKIQEQIAEELNESVISDI